MRIISILLLVLGLVVWGYAQDNLYANARGLVDRIATDVRRADRMNHDREKERERYANAQRSLSNFDKELARNKFDKDKLDSAIDDLKNVVENNSLDPRDRDELTQDLRDLRALRQNRGAGW